MSTWSLLFGPSHLLGLTLSSANEGGEGPRGRG